MGAGGTAAAAAAPTAPADTGGAATPVSSPPPPFSIGTVPPPSPLQVEPGPGRPVASDPPAPAPSTDGRVTVVITTADVQPTEGGVEVDGFVAARVEQSGTCTVTLTSGTRSARVTGTAWPDASTTSCGSIVVPAERLAPGTWRAVLSYASPSSAGSSAPVDVTVP